MSAKAHKKITIEQSGNLHTSKETSHTQDIEYKEGAPRAHHRFNILGGDIVLQVNNALFRIHRHFLIQHSVVLRDTLNVPVSTLSDSKNVTTDGNIPLTGDSVVGWECLLGLFYPDDPCEPIIYKAEQWAAVILITNKYVMESIEASAMKRLQKSNPQIDTVDLMVLAQKVGSDDLYKEALQSLAQRPTILSLEDAQKIGLSTFHDVLVTREVYFEWRKKPYRMLHRLPPNALNTSSESD